MTVASETARNNYVGTGTTGPFTFNFRVFQNADLLVTKADSDGVETTLALTTDYTVTGAGSYNGGNVTLVAALAVGETLSIRRVLDATQGADLPNQGGYFPEVVEAALDRATFLIQQLKDEFGRGLRLPETEAPSDLLTLLPALADRKGRTLGFDPVTGQPGAYSMSTDAISAAMLTVVQAATQAAAGDAFNVTAAGSTEGRSLSDRFADIVNVRDFGALGDGSTDDTAAMQDAHDTGKIVIYPPGRYKFTRITMDTGGIIGAGLSTILDSTDTTTGNVILHNGEDSTGLLVNELGAIFRDFYLRVNTATQKASGNGIKIDPGAVVENYRTVVQNVTIRNIPTCLYFTNCSFINVRDCYFAFYSDYGIYEDQAVAAFEDNGDNCLTDNYFYTNRPNAFGIKYRGGGGKIRGCKINGGLIGIDISPLRSSSIVMVQGNSIEGQTINCIRFIVEGGAATTDFSQVMIQDNQLNGYACAGPVVAITPGAAITLKDLMMTGNVIQFFTDLANAVDIRKTDRFTVANNTIWCNGLGYRGFFINADAINGQMTENRVHGFTSAHTLNNSTSVVQTQTVGTGSATYDPPNLADGAGATTTVGVTGAALGDIAFASFSIDTVGITITAWVSAADTVSVRFQNESGGAVDMASGTLRARVVKA